MLYWLMKRVLLGPLLHLGCRPRVVGAEHVPTVGGAILASNHLAVADSFFLPLVLRRRVTFLAKNEYFTAPGLRGTLQRVFFHGIGQVPIDRSSAAAAEAALRTGVDILSGGQLLGIYPEGTRSPDGRLYKGKSGVARMALEAGVVVLPVAMVGTERVNPLGSRMWRPARVQVHIGAPLDFSRHAGRVGDRFVERSITDEILYELRELSGQEYVDAYAADVKRTDAKAADVKAADVSAADARGAGRADLPRPAPTDATERVLGLSA